MIFLLNKHFVQQNKLLFFVHFILWGSKLFFLSARITMSQFKTFQKKYQLEFSTGKKKYNSKNKFLSVLKIFYFKFISIIIIKNLTLSYSDDKKVRLWNITSKK